MKYFVQVAGVEVEVSIEAGGVRVDGELIPAALEPLPGTPLRQFRMGERTVVFAMESPRRGEWEIGCRGERWEASVVDERTRHIRSLTGRAGSGPGRGRSRRRCRGWCSGCWWSRASKWRRGRGLRCWRR